MIGLAPKKEDTTPKKVPTCMFINEILTGRASEWIAAKLFPGPPLKKHMLQDGNLRMGADSIFRDRCRQQRSVISRRPRPRRTANVGSATAGGERHPFVQLSRSRRSLLPTYIGLCK